MNITTKFKLGDKAFRLHHNKVQEVTIEHFQVNVRPHPLDKTSVVEICYTLGSQENEFSTRDRDNYEYEGTLFATKADLLLSL